MLAVEVGKYLHQEGIVTFNESGIGGNCFIAYYPSTPDVVVGIYPTGGREADFSLGYDYPTIQIIVRGTSHPVVGFDLANSIFEKLQGLHHRELIPGGQWVVGCYCIQSGPIHIGRDSNNRHEYSMNFQFDVQHKTPLRN